MKEIFRFGEFRLDVDDHTVVRLDGTKNGTLTEKSFQVLVLLVRRHGHLVTKDELIRFVWPDTIVEDNNLEKCVHRLRQFLGDDQQGISTSQNTYKFYSGNFY
jgi:DNA-binding winged helix-turn-helix (wHTH) protein